jgi:Mg-chelatase subunit ChlD
MACRKFEDAAKGALDFGLVCISKRYQVGVVVFSDEAVASSPTSDPAAFRAKIDRLKCTSGGTYLTSALEHTLEYRPSYVLVVTDGVVADAPPESRRGTEAEDFRYRDSYHRHGRCG